VLTVGGSDDKNRLAFSDYAMYHSSYGPTVDGLQKPEVLAPGIWVAAPILPGTPVAERARLLAQLGGLSGGALGATLARHAGLDPALDAAVKAPPEQLRALVEQRIREEHVISEHYKHVDGTSFAAPIVSSIAAQLLEARPELRPLELKRLLVGTARRLPHVEAQRQGWGVVDAEAALVASRGVRAHASA
jgi:serine protease AprX